MAADFKIKPKVLLSEAMTSLALLGAPFQSPTFWTWKTLAKVIDGLPLTEPREIQLFEECSGRHYDRQARRTVRRLILLAGRRAGKDRFLSAVAVWRAALAQDWQKHISAGEGAVVILLGADKKQASILRKYCRGLLRTPLLAREVLRDTDQIIEFKNGASLEIITNNAALVRGRSAIGVFGSECCQWKTDEANSSSDEEVVTAAEPSMAMCPDLPGGILFLGSSVFRKRGFMYRKFRELHGNDNADDLCWFAPSATMNPALPQGVIDRALAENPNKASAEYLNVWREDSSDFVPPDVVEACTDFKVYERPPQPGIHYVAFCDAAGGLGSDSFTLAIAHREPDEASTVVLDLLREKRPRFIPRDTVAEFSAILKPSMFLKFQGINLPAVFTPTSGHRTASFSRPVSARRLKIICTGCRCCWRDALGCSITRRCARKLARWSITSRRAVTRSCGIRKSPRRTTTARHPLRAPWWRPAIGSHF